MTGDDKRMLTVDALRLMVLLTHPRRRYSDLVVAHQWHGVTYRLLLLLVFNETKPLKLLYPTCVTVVVL